MKRKTALMYGTRLSVEDTAMLRHLADRSGRTLRNTLSMIIKKAAKDENVMNELGAA